jgi:hypothetical protein
LSDLVLEKIKGMKILLFAIINLGTILFSIDSYSQTIDSNCNCDIEITSKTDELPGGGNSYDLTRNKTICFIGRFDYKLDWAKLGDNVTLCVGEEVKFKSKGLNFEGSKTIYNYGEFEYGQSLKLDENSGVVNYGKMKSKFGFEGGSLNNLNGAELSIEGNSDFNSGSLFNDNSSAFKLKQKWNTSLGTSMVFESQGESKFEGDIDNNGRLTLSGKSEFKKKLINNGFATLSGELKFEEGYNSNSSQAMTEANGILEIDGDVNLWKGHLEASAGLGFGGKTTVNEGASIHFLGSAKFDELTLRGELYTELNCNTLEIKEAKGWGGKISANSTSTISVKNLNKLPSNWILQGNVTSEKCNTNEEIVVWLGAKSSDAEDKDNWSGKIKNKNVLIPKTNYNPVFSENVSIFNVIIKEEAVLTNLAEIEIKGNLFSKGDLNSINGNFSFKGDALQTIEFNLKTDIGTLSIDNINNVEIITGSIDIFKKVELKSGNLITNYNQATPEDNLITFKSDSLNTAILAEIQSGSQIIGEVRTERYMSKSNRAFRYLSSSLNSVGTILDDWQEGVHNTVNNYNNNKNPHPGYGTHITGSKQGANGFDASLTGNSSLFTWDVSSNSWISISNTDQNKLEAGNSYSLLLRGDRNTNIYSSNSAYTGSTTLRSTGELVFGDIDLSSELHPNPQGFSLIGNPYQAQVDMKRVLQESSSHLKKNFYYAWSPALQTRGGYITVDLDSNPVEYIPSRQELDTAVAEPFRYIQPNQAVFIETAETANDQNQPSLVFKEEYKTNNTFNNEAFRTPETLGKIDLTLIRKDDNKIVDGVRFKFNDNYSNDINQFDATKVWNTEESFSILENDSNYLAIEKRKYPTAEEKLNFWIGNYTATEYSMFITMTNVEEFDVYFKDTYTGEEYSLNSGENKMTFEVDKTITESVNSNRFKIRFEQVTLGTSQNEMATRSKLYPNPSNTGYTYLKHNPDFDNELKVSVFNMVGQNIEIPKERMSSSELKLITSSLNSGIYLIKLTYQTQITTHKLIVE